MYIPPANFRQNRRQPENLSAAKETIDLIELIRAFRHNNRDNSIEAQLLNLMKTLKKFPKDETSFDDTEIEDLETCKKRFDKIKSRFHAK